MANIREIQSRINSVKDTMKITNAMYMISSSKMTQAKRKLEATEPYFYSLQGEISRILRHLPEMHHPYFDKREKIPADERKIASIVVTGDKGLAGAYNSNVLNLAWEHMQARPVHYVVTIGQMARAFFEGKHQPVDLEFTHAVTNPTLHDARGIMRDILDLYDRNLMDEVVVVFTHMYSTTVQKPELVRLLPIVESDIPGDVESSFTGEILYDPSPNEVLNVLVPQYLVGMIYSVLIHSFASEHASRMLAMSNANKNADKMLESLNLEYNRSRQSAITTELLDLASGRFSQSR